MQVTNNYDKDVFNGDPGMVCSVDAPSATITVEFAQLSATPGDSLVIASHKICPVLSYVALISACVRVKHGRHLA